MEEFIHGQAKFDEEAAAILNTRLPTTQAELAAFTLTMERGKALLANRHEQAIPIIKKLLDDSLLTAEQAREIETNLKDAKETFFQCVARNVTEINNRSFSRTNRRGGLLHENMFGLFLG